MAIRCRWKMYKKCRPDWRTVKQQARTEAVQRKRYDEALLGRELTEGELVDMLTEIEIHGITFAKSRCHIGDAGVIDADTSSRCRCNGCAKPAPAKKEDAERVRWRRKFRESKPGCCQ